MGMTHPDVARLQQFLNGRGYTVSTTGTGSVGQESNYFGLKTQQALMRFQTDNHIVPPNGKLGPITRTLINNLLGGTTSPVIIAPPTTPISTTTTTYVFTRSLKLGATGTDVKALQVYLNSHGSPVATSGPGSIGNESSYFGMATKNALAKFQKAHSIEPAEGYFGQITRTFINNN
jgi:peptidoglycan hydrolase-like protein with peptidoglycan-binding domain